MEFSSYIISPLRYINILYSVQKRSAAIHKRIEEKRFIQFLFVSGGIYNLAMSFIIILIFSR